jgi:hypothetical protein
VLTTPPRGLKYFVLRFPRHTHVTLVPDFVRYVVITRQHGARHGTRVRTNQVCGQLRHANHRTGGWWWSWVEIGGGRRGFVPGRKIVEGVIFIVNKNLRLTASLIFLTLLVIMCLKLYKYDCMLIIKKKM